MDKNLEVTHQHKRILVYIIVAIIIIFLIWYIFFRPKVTINKMAAGVVYNPNNPNNPNFIFNPTYPPFNPNYPQLNYPMNQTAQPVQPAQPVQTIYDCNSSNLRSQNGDYCLGSDQGTVQLCYHVGLTPTLNIPWYESVGNTKCNDSSCQQSKKACSNKLSCGTIAKQCNINDFGSL